MKKIVFLTVVAAIVTAPGLAFGQTGMGRSDASAGDNSGMMGQRHPRRSLEGNSGMRGRGDGQQFQQHKTRVMQRMNERVSRMQSRQNCVQAASNRQAMAACLPTRPKNHRGGNGEG